MNKKIKIGTRGSKLALIYAQSVKDKIIQNTNLNDKDILLKTIKTEGDQILNKRLSDLGGKGLFSKNIENELINGNIDLAVHALKDMPANEREGLTTDVFLERNDPREILITKDKKKLIELNSKAKIGTSSYRREFQIRNIRSDLKCELIRGNIDTRIKKLHDGLYDGIVLSYAGVKLLKMDENISEIFSVSKFIPSVGQGTIAIQCREGDIDIISILKKINHQETQLRTHAERNVLKVLEGDCETAVGAHATIKGEDISLEAELFSSDGKEKYYERKIAKVENAKKLGEEIGYLLKKRSKNSYKK